MAEGIHEILTRHHHGKIAIHNKTDIQNNHDLSMVYTPGVAEVVKHIQREPLSAREYTIIPRTIGMFTDGSAVLGLGNVGPVAGMPVMEGKAMIYRQFAGLNAYPLLLNTQDVSEIVSAIAHLAPSFGLIHIEDISAPRCFEIVEKLTELTDKPVFHDDQYGTAIVVLAGLMNALKLTHRNISDSRVVINGAGAAGIAIARVLKQYGAGQILLCDRRGIIHEARQDLNPYKQGVLQDIGSEGKEGSLRQALRGADIFIGVSAGRIVSSDMISGMNKRPIIFALANPVPEILPEDLPKGFKGIITTGRSDYPNQINNAIGYPGFVKGVLEADIRQIQINHYITAARAISSVVTETQLEAGQIIPDPFNPQVVPRIVDSIKAITLADGR